MNMNVLHHHFKFGLLLWLFALSFPAFSQQIDYHLETFVNQDAFEYITSSPLEPSIVTNGNNGVVRHEYVSGTTYQLIYNPNTDFVGKDTFNIVRYNGSLFFNEYYEVTVKPSTVDAVDDQATTAKNTSIDIEVLVNDSGSSGNISIESIGLANNGSASFEPGSSFIQFSPALDFTGIAYFNYTICDLLGSCDQATVSISVVEEDGTTSISDLKLFTKKNQSIPVLVPADFSISIQPANGSFLDGTKEYTPSTDFIGTDVFVLEDGNTEINVTITVLDFEEKQYAFGDKVFTTPNTSVEFNVLDNDNSTACFQLISQPQNGTIQEVGFPIGALTYIPNPGFTGVDEFKYAVKPPFCAGEAEEARVEISVSNFEPSASKFFMITPKRTPLVIGYNIPVSNFSFDVTNQGEFGTAVFMPGAVDTFIYNQPVKGNNIILYIPNEDVISAYDEFEVQYCVSESGSVCTFEKAVKVEVFIVDEGVPDIDRNCIDDCVWPGDTNLDGVVNMEDLLPIGITMGERGKLRADVSLDVWYGQFSEDWDGDLPSKSINLKHLDSDGNSIVSAEDTLAINRFYGFTHDFTAERVISVDQSIELTGDVVAYPGDLVELEMSMGNAENPVLDAYGFTYDFEYNPQFFEAESVKVNFENDTWLAYNSPILQMQQNNFDGVVGTGFTRTNRLAASGFGKIGKVSITITEDLIFRPDQEEIEVLVGGGLANMSTGDGRVSGVLAESATITIKLKGEEFEEGLPLSEDLLKVFPNPANNYINVHLNGLNDFEKVAVHNLMGQEVIRIENMLTNRTQLDISKLHNGFYILSVYTPKGVVNKKFEIVRN